MAECSFLCASSDGVLWTLAGCSPEGGWTTGNMWQTKEPEDQASGTDASDASMANWPRMGLKMQQCRKVSVKEGHR